MEEKLKGAFAKVKSNAQNKKKKKWMKNTLRKFEKNKQSSSHISVISDV